MCGKRRVQVYLFRQPAVADGCMGAAAGTGDVRTAIVAYVLVWLAVGHDIADAQGYVGKEYIVSTFIMVVVAVQPDRRVEGLDLCEVHYPLHPVATDGRGIDVVLVDDVGPLVGIGQFLVGHSARPVVGCHRTRGGVDGERAVLYGNAALLHGCLSRIAIGEGRVCLGRHVRTARLVVEGRQ